MPEYTGDAMTKLLRIDRDFVFIKLDYILLRTANAKLHVRSRTNVVITARVANNGFP